MVYNIGSNNNIEFEMAVHNVILPDHIDKNKIFTSTKC